MFSYSKPLQKLLKLGEFRADEWLNYAIYSIDASHKDELLKMAQDEDLFFEFDSDQEWAPLHAIYALYPIAEQDEGTITSLLEHVNKQADDDDGLWLYMEPVILRLGQKAWEPLVAIFSQPHTNLCTKERFSRTMTQLAKQYPEYRNQVIQLISTTLDDSANDNPMYKSLLLGYLCKLKATEAIESIRAAFERDAIDCAFMGDIEDVEITLGLRQERDTPARDYVAEKYPGLKELREILDGYSEEEKLDIITGMMSVDGEGGSGDDYLMPSQEPLIKGPKIGRNDPCPCGSGKKYKKCCQH